ncbi:hypothetical protein ACP4OV_013293 [Aristida adscensionis]
MSASLSSALSSMEVMLDALMQRGIGKPDDKPKEEPPPALPTRPTVRGRIRTLPRPAADAPWIQQQPPPPSLPWMQEEEEEEKSFVNLELQRRAIKAEEEAKQKDEVMRQKDEEITKLRQQVEQYQSRLSECEGRTKSLEEELKKQIALQMSHASGARRGGSRMTSQHRQESCAGSGLLGAAKSPRVKRAEEASAMRQQRGNEHDDERQMEVDKLNKEFQREREKFEHGARVVAEDATVAPPGGAKSVDELETQFGAWKKEYEARLRKAKADLSKASHVEKPQGPGQGHSHGHQRRCGWWRVKAPKCKAPKCCSFKLPSTKSCGCCFRRCCWSCGL